MILFSVSDSELFAVLTSGFSCTGGTVFAAYVALGACPESILTASILSAPMSLACSKLMYPEEQETIIKVRFCVKYFPDRQTDIQKHRKMLV